LNLIEEEATMRVPAFMLEHPLETLIAGLLLLAMLFGSADRHAAEVAKSAPKTASSAQIAAAERL
jgi:hypothetical protein